SSLKKEESFKKVIKKQEFNSRFFASRLVFHNDDIQIESYSLTDQAQILIKEGIITPFITKNNKNYNDSINYFLADRDVLYRERIENEIVEKCGNKVPVEFLMMDIPTGFPTSKNVPSSDGESNTISEKDHISRPNDDNNMTPSLYVPDSKDTLFNGKFFNIHYKMSKAAEYFFQTDEMDKIKQDDKIKQNEMSLFYNLNVLIWLFIKYQKKYKSDFIILTDFIKRYAYENKKPVFLSLIPEKNVNILFDNFCNTSLYKNLKRELKEYDRRDWTCTTCTFLNQGDNDRCEMCMTEKS
ncbi:Nuclear pore complex, rNpl4 component (sc Npl4), partial [Pseudoloma neurophilia]